MNLYFKDYQLFFQYDEYWPYKTTNKREIFIARCFSYDREDYIDKPSKYTKFNEIISKFKYGANFEYTFTNSNIILDQRYTLQKAIEFLERENNKYFIFTVVNEFFKWAGNENTLYITLCHDNETLNALDKLRN